MLWYNIEHLSEGLHMFNIVTSISWYNSCIITLARNIYLLCPVLLEMSLAPSTYRSGISFIACRSFCGTLVWSL